MQTPVRVSALLHGNKQTSDTAPQIEPISPSSKSKTNSISTFQPRDMQTRMIDSYVPDRDDAYQRRSDAPRSSSTLSENPPFRNAPPFSSPHHTRRHSSQHTSPKDTPTKLDASLPKNFAQPLTCLFWHQNGRCNKRDIDCAYAHYDTGFMAGAPVTPLDCAFSFTDLLAITCLLTHSIQAPRRQKPVQL